jgi:hypothetical protein
VTGNQLLYARNVRNGENLGTNPEIEYLLMDAMAKNEGGESG